MWSDENLKKIEKNNLTAWRNAIFGLDFRRAMNSSQLNERAFKKKEKNYYSEIATKSHNKLLDWVLESVIH